MDWRCCYALNPVLLGMILLVISRPRPVQNLFVYWVGAMLVNLPLFLVPLALLHVTPRFASFAEGLASPADASPGESSRSRLSWLWSCYRLPQ